MNIWLFCITSIPLYEPVQADSRVGVISYWSFWYWAWQNAQLFLLIIFSSFFDIFGYDWFCRKRLPLTAIRLCHASQSNNAVASTARLHLHTHLFCIVHLCACVLLFQMAALKMLSVLYVQCTMHMYINLIEFETSNANSVPNQTFSYYNIDMGMLWVDIARRHRI